jgi:hypothetical protein
VPFFKCFLLAGMVPLVSDFYGTILEECKLRCSHLHLQAVLLLSIFSHLCDGFIGIPPSVAFFCHFYYPRSPADKSLGCGMTLCLRSGLKDFLEGPSSQTETSGGTNGAMSPWTGSTSTSLI